MWALGGVGVVGLITGAVGISASRGTDDPKPSPVETSVLASETTISSATGNDSVPPSTANSTPSGPFTIEAIKSSMIQIKTKGTYRELGEQASAEAGAGSGFIISPDGLAVTNNHVVAGAAIVEVFIGGEKTARPARVVGRSECSDLALIDIDGDGFTALQWSSAPPTPGTDVYAAGFPLGDAEPTLTRGIVSKEQANGNTSWASVDHVIEHDANIQPGNSGGALVTSTGQVIGVNYAGGDIASTGTAQFFAIATDLAQPTIDKLKNGNVEALGINGRAFRDNESGATGIWVAGVEDGSPAAQAGLLPGDIISTLKGFPVALDGTMREFCQIVRSAGEAGPIGVEVYRPDAQKTFKGEFRGSPLAESFSFADPNVGGATSAAASGGQGSDPGTQNDDPYRYVAVQDDTGTISVEVPTEWNSVDGSEFDFGNGQAPAVLASTDASAYKTEDEPSTAGVFVTALDLTQFGVTDGITIPVNVYDDALDSFSESVESSCTPGDRKDFSRDDVSGRYQVFTDCGPEKTAVFVVTAAPPDSSYLVLLLFTAKTEADLYALDHAISTFRVSQ
jgi:serine protease Do